MRERLAVKKACGWLSALPIPGEDDESQILRLFALAVAEASPAQIRACGTKLRRFPWQEYGGDPVPAMIVHLVLRRAGMEHDSLAQLARAYRTVLSDSVLSGSEETAYLLGRLLAIPSAPAAVPCGAVRLLDVAELVRAAREEILEICRIVLLATAAGTVSVEADGADFLPALALSYARDWDLQTCCALLRSCAYLNVGRAKERQWVVDWILDQQTSDGSFGLLRPEAAYRGVDTSADSVDWRGYFERTIHAVWALCDVRRGSGTASFL